MNQSFFGVLEDAKVFIAAVEASGNTFFLLVVEIEFDIGTNAFVDTNGGEVFSEGDGAL